MNRPSYVIFLLVTLFAIGSLSTTVAYADSLKLPVLSDDNVVGINVYTNYQSDNRYTVNIQVQYQVDNYFEVPETITYFSMDGTQIFTIPVQDEFIQANTPVVAGEEAELTQAELDKIEQQKHIEEIRMKIDAEKNQFYQDFITCLETFETKHPVRYEAWQRTAEIEDFVLADKVPTSSNLSTIEKAIKLKTEECRHMMSFNDFGPWEANKIIDGLIVHPGLDESDSPLTVDITQSDIDEQAEIAENQKKHYNDPYKELEGINRGNSDVHLEDKSEFCQSTAFEIDPSGQICPINSLITHYEQYKEKTPEQIHDELQQLLCETYSHQYQSNRVPNWLSHCEFANSEG